MKEKITITVTDEDCRGANFLSPIDCPVARAFKREGYRVFGVIDEVSTNAGTFKPVITKADYKKYGDWGKLGSDYIQPMIDKADEGKTFSFKINFVKK